MNNLPPEVLNQIFALLYQIDRVNCMTVCQAWQAAIMKSSLLETINISTVDQFIDLMGIVEQDEKLGLQTRRLLLDLGAFRDTQLYDFPTFFPNVRTFYLTKFNEVQNIKDTRFQPWRDNLEVVIENQGCVFARQFLDSGICLRLKRISFKRLLIRSTEFISSLKNAPNLQSLELTHISINLQELEALHNAVPLLKKLDIASVHLKDGDFPANITPAFSITTISFGITNGILKQCEILQYATAKYIHLVDFSLNDKFNKFVGWDHDVESFDDAAFSYFFEKVHSKLKHLEITLIAVPVHFSELLDNANCRIQNLNIESSLSVEVLTKISLSKQAAYIQSLTLANIGFNCYTFLKELIHLKELRLSSKYKKIRHAAPHETDINTILCIDSLELLELNGFNLSCILPSRQYLLKRLVLESVVLPKETTLDNFLSGSCPFLHSLKLFNCELSGINLGHFRLPQHTLSYLCISDDFNSANNDYMLLYENSIHDISVFEPQTDNINNYFHPCDNAVQGSDKSLPNSRLYHKAFITFECASVDTVVLLYANAIYS
ncbi:hypothetical protein K501DRAFT_276668 [Backusella circina FSU 941]|nr:hypothetical protein K501DRAFT_276668 [Backusella circina FSU 941]